MPGSFDRQALTEAPQSRATDTTRRRSRDVLDWYGSRSRWLSASATAASCDLTPSFWSTERICDRTMVSATKCGFAISSAPSPSTSAARTRASCCVSWSKVACPRPDRAISTRSCSSHSPSGSSDDRVHVASACRATRVAAQGARPERTARQRLSRRSSKSRTDTRVHQSRGEHEIPREVAACRWFAVTRSRRSICRGDDDNTYTDLQCSSWTNRIAERESRQLCYSPSS